MGNAWYLLKRVSILLLIGLLSGAIFLPQVQDVHIQSDTPILPKKYFSNIVAEYKYFGFWGLPLKLVHDKIKHNILVEKVFLKKKWPFTLILDIKTKKPLAILHATQKFLVLDTQELYPLDTKVVASKHVQHLPDIFISDFLEQDHLLAMLTSLVNNLNSLNLHLARLEPLSIDSYQASLTNGMILKFDNYEFAQQIERFRIVYSKKISKRKNVTICDLRYPNGVSLK